MCTTKIIIIRYTNNILNNLKKICQMDEEIPVSCHKFFKMSIFHCEKILSFTTKSLKTDRSNIIVLLFFIIMSIKIKIVLSNITSPDDITSKILTVVQYMLIFFSHKLIIEEEINKIVNLTIITYNKGLNLILAGKETMLVFKNNIYKKASELYKKRLKIKNRK